MITILLISFNTNDIFDEKFIYYFHNYMDPNNLTGIQLFESNTITKEIISFVKTRFLSNIFFHVFSIFKAMILICFFLMAGMITFSDQQRKMITHNSAFESECQMELAFSICFKLFFSLLKCCFLKKKLKRNQVLIVCAIF